MFLAQSQSQGAGAVEAKAEENGLSGISSEVNKHSLPDSHPWNVQSTGNTYSDF